jgi:RNA:NAD 2'-phosphotransferase (TPT1/KptA family)
VHGVSKHIIMSALSKGDRKLSRTLTYILRHGAVENGLAMDGAGFVRATDLYKSKDLRRLDEETLRLIVASDSKNRFELDEGPPLRVRATQGHSIKLVQSDQLLTPITHENRPEFAVHGTSGGNYALIHQSGYLDRMNRNHIHFAIKLPGESGLVSGMRSSSSVLIYLDIDKCLQDRVPLYLSTNGVVLTPGVGDTGRLPEEYFSEVVRRK